MPACPPEVCLLAQDQSVPEAVEVLVEYRRVPQPFQGRRGAVLCPPTAPPASGAVSVRTRGSQTSARSSQFSRMPWPRTASCRAAESSVPIFWQRRLGLLDEILPGSSTAAGGRTPAPRCLLAPPGNGGSPAAPRTAGSSRKSSRPADQTGNVVVARGTSPPAPAGGGCGRARQCRKRPAPSARGPGAWASSMSTPPVMRPISLAMKTASEKLSAACTSRTAAPAGRWGDSVRPRPGL